MFMISTLRPKHEELTVDIEIHEGVSELLDGTLPPRIVPIPNA